MHLTVVAAQAVYTCSAGAAAKAVYESEFRGQRIRRVERHGDDVALVVERFVDVDMVGIFSPLGAIELAQALGHEDAEVGGQVVEGVGCHHGHCVACDIDGIEARAAREGIGADGLDAVGQRYGAQCRGVVERGVELLHPHEVSEFQELLHGGVVVEDAFRAFLLRIVAGEVQPVVGERAHHGIVLERRHHVVAAAHQVDIAHVVADLRIGGEGGGYIGLPRVFVCAGGMAVGQEYEFLYAL